MRIKLAQALLRRKELQNRLVVLQRIKDSDLFEVKTARKKAHEGLDDVIAQVPRLRVAEVTKAFDTCGRQLREVDAVIQQTNWTCEVEIAEDVMKDPEL